MSLQLAEQFEANEQYEQAYEEYKKLHIAACNSHQRVVVSR